MRASTLLPRPWLVGAAVIAALALFMMAARPAEAAIAVTFTLNDNTASANTDASLDITLEGALNDGETITVTFPAGWTVADGALTTGGAAIDFSGFALPPTAVTGSSAARTVTITINGFQPAVPMTVTFNPSAEIQNAPNGTNVTVLVDATGQAQGASAPFSISAGGITGGNVTLTSAVAGAQTAGTIAFTLPGALANGDSIVLTFPAGWTVANGAMTAANWQGLDGAVPTSVTGSAAARTVTIVVSAAQNTLAETLTIVAGAELVNPTTAAAGLTINVAATGQTAGNTNAFAIVAGTPTAAQSTVAAAPASVAADGATTSTITVTLRDVNSNPASGKTVTLAQGAGSSTISAASGASSALGVVTFTVTNTTAEVVTYTATDTTDAVVVTQTANVTFTAGTPSAANSTVASAPGSVAADGATTSTITVTLRDGSNVAVAGKTVTLAQSAGGASVISAASGASNGAGVVTFTVTNTTAQTVTYTATDTTDAVVVTQTASVTFTPGTPTAAASTVVATPTSVDADGSSSATVSVTLRDVNSNAVPGKTVALAAGGGSSTITGSPAVTNASGIATFIVTNGTVEVVTYTATDTTDAVVVTQTAAVTFVTPPPPPSDDSPPTGPNPFMPPVTCQPGSYNEGGTCTSAPPGSFVALSGATSPTLCAIGTYQNLSGSTFCFAVPSGTFTSTPGATAATPWTVCQPGQVEVTAGTATSDRVCGLSPTPKLTALALVPLNAAGTLDVNVPFSDWPRASLTGGQTTFTLIVTSGRSYGVAAQADSGEITYRRGGISFDPATTRLAAGDTVTVQAVNSAGTSPTYTVTLGSAVACLNGGVATNGTCVCPPGFTGTQCEIATALRLTALSLVPQQAGYASITVPVVDGQTVYEVDVPAFDAVTKAPRYNLSATMSDPAAPVKVSSFGLEWDPTSIAFQSGESATFSATGSGGTSPKYTVRLRAAAPVCLNGGVASGSGCVCPTGFSGAQCQIPSLSEAAITLSSNAPSATGVTVTYSLRTPVAIPADGKIKVRLTGFTWPATPGASFTAGAGTATVASTSFASNVLTVTTATSAISAGTVTLRVTGATNPAAQTARSDVRFEVTSSADAVLASTSTGTMPAITAPETAVTAVTISANPRVAGGATTITTVATYTTGLAAADAITVKLSGYTFNAGAVTVIAGPGFAGTLTGTVSAGATDTLVITGAEVPAGVSATFTFPATNPPAATTVAKASLEVKTSKDTTATASSADIVLTAPPALAVTLTVPSTAAAGGSIAAIASVTGAGGRTVSYSWTSVGSGCGDQTLNASNAAVWALDVTGSGTCAISVTATVGTQSASASATVIVAEAGQPQLEFTSQPQDSTTGTADINLSVRAVKADRTVDTAFNNQVQLTIQGGGSSYGLGSVTAVNGVATFTMTYNPSRADATWTLRATQISGRAAGVYAPATSTEFRVTKPPTLRFTTQPVGGSAGAALTTQPVVTAYTANGAVDTTFTGTVTLTLKSDTANGATLTSTAPAAVAGVATFTRTSINNAGTGYVLVASATGYGSVASEAFDVTSAATLLVFTQSPASARAGQAFLNDVHVEARDAAYRVVPGAAANIQLSARLVPAAGQAASEQSLASRPARVEGGTAVFSDRAISPKGTYVLVATSGALTAESGAFDVSGAPAKLAFVQQPAGFGSVLGTQPIVEIQDADGNRIPGATNEVTLTFLATNDTDPIMTGGARRAATAGRVTYTAVGFTGGTARPGATFTVTASATGLTPATSASFGPAGPTTKLAFTSDLPCGLVARPGCSPAAKEGQSFTITVAAQDASGQVNPNEDGLATLTGDGNSGMAARLASFIQGVATFTGVSFTGASTTGYTLTATAGVLTVASGKIVVTADNTPASLRFRVGTTPSHEVTGVDFTARPEVRVYNAAGREITDPLSGNIVLRLRKQDGTTTSLFWGNTSSAIVSGVARDFNSLRVTGADTGLYLSATLEGTTLEANQTGTFRVYADATSATTARASEQRQRVSFKLSFNLACGSNCESSVKSEVCNALQLGSTACSRILVTRVSASSVVMIGEDGRVLAVANVDVVDGQEIVTIGGLNLRTFEAEYGATAPAGTSALYAAARIAVDAYGNRLETLSAPRSFSLPVPESVVLLGTRPGDLKVAWWDDAARRWTLVPTRGVVNEDGSFTVTATTDALGAFAVLYAPGASRIESPGVFSADGAGFGVFAGGSTGALAHAAGLNDATGAWVQDAAGEYRLLVVGGPAFLGDEFAARFPQGIAANTAVTLVRPAAAPDAFSTADIAASVAPVPATRATAPVATGAPLTSATHTVTSTDTLSEIALRYGLETSVLASANGISGPNFVVRAGQVLTIPAGGKTLVSHTVSATDTLSGIGALYGVSWTSIAAMNNIAGPSYFVRPGQVLTIAR